MRASASRFLLMVIAIAISLTVFGAILGAWGAIGRETAAAYAGTEPASATILLDQGVDAGRMAAVVAQTRARQGVVNAAARTQFSTDIAVNGTARDHPLQVFVTAPDDPLRMARFVPARGGWPPSPGEIFLRRDSLGLLDVAVGDVVTIQTPTGVPVSLRVADTVYDPSLAPSPQHQVGIGYLSTAALAGAQLDQVKIQVADPGGRTPSRDRDRIVEIAGQVGTWLQAEHGLRVREIQVPQPYAHPHQWQADALLLALLAGAAAALLLSTILVANMLNNLFTRQIPQIGIMKAIGAGSVRIGRLYLAMTLLVAALATLLALPPAILLARAGLVAFSGFLGVQPDSLAPPWWTYPVILAAGLGLPVLMALIPLVKASRTTVRAAIDHYGLSARPTVAGGFLTRLRGLDRGLLLALRNTVRRPARFWLSVSLLACAGVVFVAGMSLNASTQAVETNRTALTTWDVDVQLGRPVPMAEVSAALRAVPDLDRVEGWTRAQAGVSGPDQISVTRTYPDQGHGSITVTAIPASTSTLVVPTLLDGRWLNPGETGAVVLNQVARNNTVPGVRPGDPVQLLINGQPTRWRVVGIVTEHEGGTGGTYVTAEGLAAATGQPERVNMLRITTAGHTEPTRTAVADAARTALAGAGIEVRGAASVSRAETVTAGHLGPVLLILLAIAIPLGALGIIGLATTMSANVLDRTREFGVMHAIGARPGTVRRVVVAEGVILALTSCLLAVAPALGLTRLLGIGLGNLFFSAPLPYRVSALAAGLWVILVLLGAALATDAAATRASRITVCEALI